MIILITNSDNQIEEVTLPDKYIPKDSFFGIKKNTLIGNDKKCKTDLTLDEYEVIYDFLVYRYLPHTSWFSLFDQYLITDEYMSSMVQEIDMRENMYNELYKDHKMNTNPYYGLVKLDDKIWKEILEKNATNRVVNDPELLFPLMNRRWRKSYSTVLESVTNTRRLRNSSIFSNVSNIAIAGGKVFSALTGNLADDIDIFIYGLSEDDAEKKIKEIYRVIRKRYSLGILEVSRSKNVININVSGDKYQIILRLYRTPSEIIHGFDVDCCCMLYIPEENNIYMTKRCKYSLEQGYNTVNFERLSPSYPHRLAKYASKGIRVKIYGFKRENVSVKEDFSYISDPGREFEKMKKIKELQGIDILLYIEELIKRFGNKGYNLFKELTKISDYDDFKEPTYYDNFKESKYFPEPRNIIDPPPEILDGLQLTLNNRKKLGMKELGKKPLVRRTFNEYNQWKLKFVNGLIDKSTNESSDYDIAGKANTPIKVLIDILIKNKKKYPEKAEKYMKIIERLTQRYKDSESYSLKKELFSYVTVNEEIYTDFDHIDIKVMKYADIPKTLHKVIIKTVRNADLDTVRRIKYTFFSPKVEIKAYNIIRDNKKEDFFQEKVENVRREILDYSYDRQKNHMEIIFSINVESLKVSKYKMIKIEDGIDEILRIDDDIYELLRLVKDVDFPKNVAFKVTNPGEQMTNTFNQLVLEDNNEWFKGHYYKV